MINVKEFVYCKLSSDASLSSLVGNRIFANIMPEMNKTFPVIIYQRISNGKWDTK
jgi:hypothetical protein